MDDKEKNYVAACYKEIWKSKINCAHLRYLQSQLQKKKRIVTDSDLTQHLKHKVHSCAIYI